MIDLLINFLIDPSPASTSILPQTQLRFKLPARTPLFATMASSSSRGRSRSPLGFPAISKAALRAGGGFGDKGKGEGKIKGKGEGMQIFVKHPTSNTITLDVEPSDLIIGVKALIEGQEGIEVMGKSLVKRCGELAQLSELAIRDGDTLHLVDMPGET